MSDCPVVSTKNGKVRGRVCAKAKKANAKKVFRYASIPFAKPPLGDLRFEPPQNPSAWNDVLDCTKMCKSPVQSDQMWAPFEHLMPFPFEFEEKWTEFSEDCLYLNVYTANPNPSAKMPVLVWFYGGAFTMGSAACYDGSVLASLHDVVVVIPNYRVNSLGFISFPGEDSPYTGNVGLLDQVKALEWVRDNVMSFGGNPGNVTIFGESAGAISVGCHLVSPMSKGLFHRAISHSGVSSIEMMVSDDNKQSIEEMLAKLEITEKDPKKIVQLLKKLPAEKLPEAQNDSLQKMSFITPIKCDGKFLPKKPDQVLSEGKFHQIPYIIGVNSTECSGLSAPGKDKGFDDGLSEKDSREILQQVFGTMAPAEKVSTLVDAAVVAYSKDLDSKDATFWSKIAAACFKDMWFVVNSKKMAATHAGKPATYFYEMSQQVQFHHDRAYNQNPKSEMKGDICECDHGDDIYFTFGLPFADCKLTFDVKFTEEEKQMSENWMKYLVNFANTGDPNKGPYKLDVSWSPYNASEDNYLNVHNNFEMKKGLSVNGFEFWTKKLPALLSA